MRSCQAPFPGWPWIHPVICYTASPDSDEHNAGSWQHPYSLQKGKKWKKRERWKVIGLPPFNASLICTTFRGPAWGGDDEVCLYNYVKQEIQHPWAPVKLSIKLPRCWHFGIFFFFLIKLSVAHIYCRHMFWWVCHRHNGHRAARWHFSFCASPAQCLC